MEQEIPAGIEGLAPSQGLEAGKSPMELQEGLWERELLLDGG